MGSKKKHRHGGVSKRGRRKNANPLLGKKLIKVRFGQLLDGAFFSLDPFGIGLYRKIPVPEKYKGKRCPHNAKHSVYGNPTVHFGSDLPVWTTEKELGKGKEIYEETLRRG